MTLCSKLRGHGSAETNGSVGQKQEPESPFIIFLHIQKTAGVTFQRILRRNFGLSFVRRAAGLFEGKTSQSLDLLESMKSKTRKDRYFAGHVCYGVHRFLPKPFVYVCFLRDPIPRLLSLYRYSRKNPTAYYHAQASQMSADDFFMRSGLMELDNGQVRFVAGSEFDPFINRTAFGECGPDLLARAVENIERDFAFVGVTEQFDASLLLMRNKISLHKILYLPRNRATQVPSMLPSDEVLQDLTELNRYDIQLYSKICQKLETLILERVEFDKELKQFQHRNRIFQIFALPAYNRYDYLKSKIRGQLGRPM